MKTIVVGIICITILEGIALMKGMDGTMLALSLSTIAGVLGYHARRWYNEKKSQEKD